MSRARETYLCLKLVEYTSIPLAFCIMLYLLSGYGIISPVFNLLGFTYLVSVKIHTLPLLRLVTAALTILHLYGGIIILSSRHIKNKKIRRLTKLLTLVMILILSLLIVSSELETLF